MQEDPAARRKLLAALDGLPDIVEATSYGEPAFKVGKKFLCRIRDATSSWSSARWRRKRC